MQTTLSGGIDITNGYINWRDISFALVDTFGEEGRQFFHRLSQFHGEYNFEKCDKQYTNSLKSQGSGITIGTLLKICKKHNLNINFPKEDFNVDDLADKFISADKLIRCEIEKIPTLLNPILPKTGLVALAGSSDTGKSSFLRQLAIHISSGNVEFLNFRLDTIHKKVIYFSSEDDKNAISYLLKKQNEHFCYPDSKYSNLKFLFESEKMIKTIENEIMKEPVDLIIVDAFSDVYPGDLNQTNKVRSFLNDFQKLTQKYECLIIFLHHNGKRTDNLAPSKDNLLGSQGFESKMRLVVELRKDKDDEDIRHLCILKGNYLDNKFKNSSYKLIFDQNMIFHNTNEKINLNDLVLSNKKISKAEKERIKIEALKWKEDGKTVREIAVILETSKSTIDRLLKE